MDLVKVEIEVPKEAKEVVDALAGVAEHFLSGKGLDEAAALLPSLLAAVEGVQDVLPALKSEYKDELAAYLVKRVWQALEVKREEVPPTAA